MERKGGTWHAPANNKKAETKGAEILREAGRFLVACIEQHSLRKSFSFKTRQKHFNRLRSQLVLSLFHLYFSVFCKCSALSRS